MIIIYSNIIGKYDGMRRKTTTHPCLLCGENCNGTHNQFCSSACKSTYIANLNERAYTVGMDSRRTHTQLLSQ